MDQPLVSEGDFEQTNHDWGDRYKRIVNPPGFLDTASLESDLKTATSHSKAHRIHVDVVLQSSAIFRLCSYRLSPPSQTR